jgi:hypothetical protein
MYPAFNLTEDQLCSNNWVMFGTLKSIFRQGQVQQHLCSHEESQEGMQAWSAIVQDFDMGGAKAVLIEKYETQISVKDHHNYQGGLTGFVQDYEDACRT